MPKVILRLSPSRLSPQAARSLRERIVQCLIELDKLSTTDPLASPHAGDFDLNPRPPVTPELIPAAVLVPLVSRPQGFTILLTQRTEHLHDHAGQISFPGGRVEAFDDGPVATALRETEEEIRLNRRFVEIAGALDNYETATGFLVTPVVGFVRPGFTLEPDRFEVADIFEMPLAFVLDPTHHQTASRVVCGKERTFYVFEYREHFIWGATAGMLMNLFRRLSDQTYT